MATSDLHAIRRALEARLGSDTLFSFLNTRIILRTGVDLSRIKQPVQNAEDAHKVLRVLKEMGYDLVADLER